MKISIKEEEIQQARQFAIAVKDDPHNATYGPRTEAQIITDFTKGKVGEIGLSKLLNNENIICDLNWISDKTNNCDRGDIVHEKFVIEVKSCVWYAKNLLIPGHSPKTWKKYGIRPNYVCFVIVPQEEPYNQIKYLNGMTIDEYGDYAKFIKKDELLPSTNNYYVKADTFYVDKKHGHDFDHLLKFCRGKMGDTIFEM